MAEKREHHHPHPPSSGHIRHAPMARGAGRDQALFLDTPSGIAGDMLVAALLDLGVPLSIVQQGVDALSLSGTSVSLSWVERSGIVAPRFVVRAPAAQPERSHAQIRDLIRAAGLTQGAQTIALDAFERLAEAEAEVHQVPVEDVHFHEVGAVDSIVDIVASAIGLDHIGARVMVSPLPLGRGLVHARHGVLPLPAPATVVCLRGVATYDGGADAELVTPTGACLVAAVAQDTVRWPSMKPLRVGWGAGQRNLPDRPNLLRAVLGEPDPDSQLPRSLSTCALLQANLDDSTGETVGHAIEILLAAGALDAWAAGIGMKKGRPGWMLSVLTRPPDAERLARTLMAETTTLGVRVALHRRFERPRRLVQVDTRFGPIPVKVSDGDGLPRNLAPEHDACRAAAQQHGVPLKQVYVAALVAAHERI